MIYLCFLKGLKYVNIKKNYDMIDYFLFQGGCVYSTMYNLLNYPAGVVPVTKVTEQDIQEMADYPQKTKFEKNIKKVMILLV